jgi:hypothetical protein
MADGQAFHGRVMGLIPAAWRGRLENPVLRGPNPAIGFKNLAERLRLEKGCLFSPPEAGADAETVLYFPGCGAGLFTAGIGMAALDLLLRSGVRVVIPPAHLCCGYPLAVSGMAEAFAANRERTLKALEGLMETARGQGFLPTMLLTACGTCREALAGYDLAGPDGPMGRQDVTQFLAERLPAASSRDGRICTTPPAMPNGPACRRSSPRVLPRGPGLPHRGDGGHFPGLLRRIGPGALTSPDIHNRIRAVKTATLRTELSDDTVPVVVAVPPAAWASPAAWAKSAARTRCGTLWNTWLNFMADRSGDWS